MDNKNTFVCFILDSMEFLGAEIIFFLIAHIVPYLVQLIGNEVVIIGNDGHLDISGT